MASKDKTALLAQFRDQLVKDNLLRDGDSIGTDDATLARFLRARQYNLRNAKLMWKNCYEWRNTAEGVGIDGLYRQIDPFDYPERNHVFQFWPSSSTRHEFDPTICTDKKGRPLNIHHFGRINTTALYKGITPDRFWQAFLVNAESLTREVLPASSSAAGKHIDGTFVIVDLKGFGTGQFWQMKGLARGAFQVSQDYFPETMSQLAIVNAPSSFTTIWAIMRPWLAKETVAKVSVLGTNYHSALLELVDPENLPESLGGTCTCEDCVPREGEGKAVEEEGGVAEMGRCAFSSAGPWLFGRKERREGWLRGERDIALHPEDLERYLAQEEAKTIPASEHSGSDDKHTDSVEDETLPTDGSASEEASAGPSTPEVQSLHQQADKVAVKGESDTETTSHPFNTEQSVQLVAEKYPDSRQVAPGLPV